MKNHLIIFIFCLNSLAIFGQINPDNIQIARDKWGVPHIYAATDAEVAYGLAWATAEDDFKSMQENFLCIRGRLAEVKGKDGAIFDFFAYAIEAKQLVEKNYETGVSDDFKKVLEGYTKGVNAFAKKYPDEVLLEGVFPLTTKDILQGYVLNLTLLSGVHQDIAKIFNRNIKRYEAPQGSNGIAVNASRTEDGNTYLAINSHQPLEGPFAWYEAHVESEEGWQMIGANFAGGVTLFVGSTPNLGWTHTVNAPDLCDVYRLEMNPDEKLQYRFDGKWETLEKRVFKTKVKVGFLKFPYKKTVYKSKYGLTFKNKDGFYSVRFPGSMTSFKAAEQWFRMNKAQNLEGFMEALRWQGIGCTNIVYADKEQNIMYLGNGNFPYRDPQFDWKKVLPGNTSKTLWKEEFYPIDSLAYLLNPKSNYLFNTNNTPFNATAPSLNIDSNKVNSTIGYFKYDNNRSKRLQYLMSQTERLSYEDFKKIKYDQSWMRHPTYSYSMSNLELLFELDKTKYPEIAPLIELLVQWDGTTHIHSNSAAIFVLTLGFLNERLDKEGRTKEVNFLAEAEYVTALKRTKKYLNRHFGSIYIPLGQLQRHTRGDVSLAISGAPDVLAAIYGTPQKNGQLRIIAGESYIQMVQYTTEGAIIESVNAYGSSAEKDSPHYTDQMELYVKQQLKSMTFDKVTILKNAERVYSPK
jgi:acyl-homoserine-lactone acylase